MPQPTSAELMAAIVALGERMERRFAALDQRFDAQDQRFDAQDKRFDAMDRRFDAMDRRFDVMDRRFDVMDNKIDQLTARVGGLEKKVEGLEKAVNVNTAQIAELRGEQRGLSAWLSSMDQRFVAIMRPYEPPTDRNRP